MFGEEEQHLNVSTDKEVLKRSPLRVHGGGGVDCRVPLNSLARGQGSMPSYKRPP